MTEPIHARRSIVAVRPPEWRIFVLIIGSVYKSLSIGLVASSAALYIHDAPPRGIGRAAKKRQPRDASAFGGLAFGYVFAEPEDIGFYGLAFGAIGGRRLAVEAALKTIVYALVEVFDAARPRAKLRISRRHCAKIIAKRARACVEVTVLAVEPVGAVALEAAIGAIIMRGILD